MKKFFIVKVFDRQTNEAPSADAAETGNYLLDRCLDRRPEMVTPRGANIQNAKLFG